MSEAEEIFTGDSTADETDEPPIRVRRRVPWARILALTAVIILAGVLASVTIIVGQRHAHAQALASCNQAIQQSNKLYDQWNAALDAAKPLLALGDTDVTDHEALVSLRNVVEHHTTNEIPHCSANLSTVHLEEKARTADEHNKQTKTVLDELSKATTTVKQSQRARRLTNAKTKLSDAIDQAEDLYQRTEANADVNVSETRVSLGSQLDTARNTLHTTTDITTLDKAADDLNAFTQRLSDAIKQAEEAPAASAEPSETSESQSAPSQQQPSTSTTHPTPAAPAIPQPAPQSSPSAPSWDVPSADSSTTFPDVL
jgi:cell division protein FtsL